jgi:hypothetical protein
VEFVPSVLETHQFHHQGLSCLHKPFILWSDKPFILWSVLLACLEHTSEGTVDIDGQKCPLVV